MPLPEINVASGWVRQPAAAPYYFKNVGGQLVPAFRKECLNDAIEVSYLPEKAGVPGPQGPRGADGRDGQNGRDGRDGQDGSRGPRGLRGMFCPECSVKVEEQTAEKIFLSAGHPALQEEADFKSAKVFVRLAGQKDPKVLFSSENEKEFWKNLIAINTSDLGPGEHTLTLVITYHAKVDGTKCVVSCSVKVKVPSPKAVKKSKTGLVIGIIAAGAGVGLAVALGGGGNKNSPQQPPKGSTGIFVP